jgi:hypothetical protein
LHRNCQMETRRSEHRPRIIDSFGEIFAEVCADSRDSPLNHGSLAGVAESKCSQYCLIAWQAHEVLASAHRTFCGSNYVNVESFGRQLIAWHRA